MKEFSVQYLDTKDHAYISTIIFATDIKEALDLAKSYAYNKIDKHKIIIRYVSVLDPNDHYVYNMLTKKTEKWY